jgi:hypothetical protein
MDADGGAGGVDVPFAKRRAFDNTSGKVSHRPWKAPFSRASAVAVRPQSDWDRKMREKEQKKAIQVRTGPAVHTASLPHHRSLSTRPETRGRSALRGEGGGRH